MRRAGTISPLSLALRDALASRSTVLQYTTWSMEVTAVHQTMPWCLPAAVQLKTASQRSPTVWSRLPEREKSMDQDRSPQLLRNHSGTR